MRLIGEHSTTSQTDKKSAIRTRDEEKCSTQRERERERILMCARELERELETDAGESRPAGASRVLLNDPIRRTLFRRVRHTTRRILLVSVALCHPAAAALPTQTYTMRVRHCIIIPEDL